MLILSLTLLILSLPSHRGSPTELLRSAATLWFSNILVFASWYWRLDAGGPNARDLRGAHTEGAFLFPQMTVPATVPRTTLDKKHTSKGSGQGPDSADSRTWSPGFIDYLFLAFNTSTASPLPTFRFSPDGPNS